MTSVVTAQRSSPSRKESVKAPSIKLDSQIEKIVAETQERIYNLSAEINTTVEGLDEKLDTVLEKNEKDFLTAYRFHMLKVQNELMQLKKKANETELKTL